MDITRDVDTKGLDDIKSIGSYMLLKGTKADLVLSSYALRTQVTADRLAEMVEYHGKIHYMKELYLAPYETLINIVSLQDSSIESIFLVGHNPGLTEFAKHLIDEEITEIPTLGVLAIDLDIEKWSEIDEARGKIDFFINPKQFKYYLPSSINALGR